MNQPSASQDARKHVAAAGVDSNATRQFVTPQTASQRVLALDLATKTGWAITTLGTGRIIASGMRNLTPKSSIPMKFQILAELIGGLHKQHTLGAVIVEAPNPFGARSMENTRIALGLSTHAEFLTATLGLSFLQPLSTSTLKKHAATLIGDAKATKGKQQAIQAATSLLGRAPVDDNEADAVVLAHWASLNAKEINR